MIADITADQVTKTATASGDVVIPSVAVDEPEPVDSDEPEVIGNTEEQTVSVSLPVTWTEDGHADVIFSFEFNNQMIPVHYPQENWHSGRHTILLYYPIENVVPNYTNTFNVYMRCSGGTAADNLYLTSSNPPIAYASNDVNATANTRRGSLNLTESIALTNGYKFVWEFTASQGNGTIAAIGLTSKQGGANAYGSEVAVDTTLLQIRKVSLDDDDGFINDLYRCVTVDFTNGKLYSLSYASNTVTIKRYRIPVFDIGLNEKLDDSTLTLEDTTVLQCSTFRFYGSYMPYGIFMDGGDGYWYGFSNQGNSSGSATVLWIKIKQNDYSFTEGSWTLSNATLMTMGSFKEGSSYPSGNRSAVVGNGYLYVPSYDKTGVYKINISNSTDVTLISLGFTAAMRCIGETGSTDCCLTLINDIIVAYDFQIDVNDNVLATYAGEHCGNISTPFFRYKEYVFAWGGAYLNQYRYTFLLTPYLATISNLSQAVVKDASKTMKITYTLTENTV